MNLFTVMFCIFLVLKLTQVIHWSWWWVSAPLWGGFLIALLMSWLSERSTDEACT